MDRYLAKFLKKAEKKNKPKKVISNKVLLLKKDFNTNYTHLKNNMSDILYEKKEINLNNIEDKELIKEVVSAKYIFIDTYDPRLSGFNYENQETIFVGNCDGFFSEELNMEVDELEQIFFSKMKHVVVGSSLMKNYYKKKYNLDNDQFLDYGFYLNDKFFAKRFELDANSIADNYLNLLDKVNVYYIPKSLDENIKETLLEISENLDNSNKLYYISNHTYDFDVNKIQQVYPQDYRYMFKFANVIISDGNKIIFEMYKINSNIKLYNNNEQLLRICNQINNNNFACNDQQLQLNWQEYDDGMCCRNIVNRLMRLV